MSIPVKVFISYAREDESYKNKFLTHLSGRITNGEIEVWTDNRILPSQDWDEAIKSNLDKAEITVFLVSSDFLNSKYINNVELARAVELSKNGKLKVVPVIIRSCDLTSRNDLARLNALPKDAKPVSTWTDKDAAWVDVVNGLMRLVNVLRPAPLPPSTASQPVLPPSPQVFNGGLDVLKGKVNKLVSKGELTLALEELSKSLNSRSKNDMIMLQSRNASNERDKRNGIITNEAYGMGKARITQSLLAFMNDLEEDNLK